MVVRPGSFGSLQMLCRRDNFNMCRMLIRLSQKVFQQPSGSSQIPQGDVDRGFGIQQQPSAHGMLVWMLERCLRRRNSTSDGAPQQSMLCV